MSTILSDAANLFPLINDGGVVDKSKIRNVIAQGDYLEERVEIIIDFYKLLFESSILNNVSKLFVKTNMKYSNLAEQFNIIYAEEIEKGRMKAKAENNIKVDISYCNKKLESTLLLIKNNGEKSNCLHELIVNSKIEMEIINKGI